MKQKNILVVLLVAIIYQDTQCTEQEGVIWWWKAAAIGLGTYMLYKSFTTNANKPAIGNNIEKFTPGDGLALAYSSLNPTLKDSQSYKIIQPSLQFQKRKALFEDIETAFRQSKSGGLQLAIFMKTSEQRSGISSITNLTVFDNFFAWYPTWADAKKFLCEDVSDKICTQVEDQFFELRMIYEKLEKPEEKELLKDRVLNAYSILAGTPDRSMDSLVSIMHNVYLTTSLDAHNIEKTGHHLDLVFDTLLHNSPKLPVFIRSCMMEKEPSFPQSPFSRFSLKEEMSKNCYDYIKDFISNMANYAEQNRYAKTGKKSIAAQYAYLMRSFINYILRAGAADIFYNDANEHGYIEFGKYLDNISKNPNAGYCLSALLSAVQDGIEKESQTKQQTVSFKDYVDVPEEAKDLVKQIKNPAEYEDMKIPFPSGLLFYGPPGTGKTYLAQVIAGEAQCPFFVRSGPDLIPTRYIGTGNTKVKNLFEDIREAAQKNNPQVAILFIDEIDALGSRESEQNSAAETINQLLTEISGFDKTKEKVVVIAATNNAEKIDPALKRSGRFDKKIYIGYPNEEARKKLFSRILTDRKIDKNINPITLENLLAALTEGFSQSDITAFINDSARKALSLQKNILDYDSFARALWDRKVNKSKELLPKREEQKKLMIELLKSSGIAYDDKLLNSLLFDIQDMTDDEIKEIFAAAAKKDTGSILDWVLIAIEAKKKQKIIRDNKEVVALCNQIYGASGVILNFDEVASHFVGEGNISTNEEDQQKSIREFWYTITADDIFTEFSKRFDALYKAPAPEEERPEKILPIIEQEAEQKIKQENKQIENAD